MLADLYNERNRLLRMKGIDAKVKPKAEARKAESPEADLEMPESAPQEGEEQEEEEVEEDDENEEQLDETPDEEVLASEAPATRNEPAVLKRPSGTLSSEAPEAEIRPPNPPISKRPASSMERSHGGKRLRATLATATAGNEGPQVQHSAPPPSASPTPWPFDLNTWHRPSIPITDLDDMWEAAAPSL